MNYFPRRPHLFVDHYTDSHSLLPTMGLVAYEILANLEVAKRLSSVAKGLHQLGKIIENFQWNDLR